MNDSQNKIIFKDDEGKETLVLDFGIFAHDNILDLKEGLLNLDIKKPISVEDISSLVKGIFKDTKSKVDQFNEFSLNIKADIQKNEETKIVENDPISVQADIIKALKEFAEGLVVQKASDLKKKDEVVDSKEKKEEKKPVTTRNSTPAFLNSDKIFTKSDGLNPDYKDDATDSKETESSDDKEDSKIEEDQEKGKKNGDD